MKRRDMMGGTAATVLSGFTALPAGGQSQGQPNLLGYLRTNWSRDPFSFGTYSHLAKGSKRKHHRQLAQPVADRLYFAGEAANPERNSSVHSALESGRLVGAELLNQDHARIGIIGAGIAGLSVAQILDAAGRDVTVLEARGRIGGRIHTDRSMGFAADLGASWLHGSDGNPVTDVTDQLGMRKAVSDLSWIVRANGRELSEQETPAWLEEIASYNNTAGTSRESMNEWGYLFLDDYTGDEILFPDGYDQILDAFKGSYRVTLNETVTAIDYGQDDVRVTASSGGRSFDAVVVTVPLGVLKAGAIGFTPALPKKTQQAIDVLGFGTLDKIYMQFDQVFWDEEPHNILTPLNGFEPGFFNSWVNLYPTMGKPVLLCFNGGPAALALSSEPDDVVVERARATILEAYGLNS